MLYLKRLQMPSLCWLVAHHWWQDFASVPADCGGGGGGGQLSCHWPTNTLTYVILWACCIHRSATRLSSRYALMPVHTVVRFSFRLSSVLVYVVLGRFTYSQPSSSYSPMPPWLCEIFHSRLRIPKVIPGVE